MTQPTLQLTTNKNLASVKNITIRDSGNKEVLEAYFLDHEGQPYNLENKTVTFMENKIGDKFVSDSNVEIVNPNAGQIKYTLQSQVHSASGIAWFEINDSSGLVDSTANFNIRVEDGLRATADNTTYIDALEKLKRQMEALIQQADGELKAELQKAEQQLNQELQNFRNQYNSLSADFQNQFKTAQNARQQDYNNQKNAINTDWTNNKGIIWGQWNDDKASIDKQAQDTIQAIKDNAKQVLDKDQADWNAKQKQWDSTFSAIVKEWQVKTNSLNATVQDLTNKFNTIIGQVSDLMDNKLPAMNSKTDAVQAKVDELRASLGQIDWTTFARRTDNSGGVNLLANTATLKGFNNAGNSGQVTGFSIEQKSDHINDPGGNEIKTKVAHVYAPDTNHAPVYFGQNFTLPAGTWTLSFLARNNSNRNETNSLSFFTDDCANRDWQPLGTTTIDSVWKKHAITFTTTKTTVEISPRVHNPENRGIPGGSLYFANFKLEAGSIATDWCQSYLDFNRLDGQVDAIDGPNFNDLNNTGIYQIINTDHGQNYPISNWGILKVENSHDSRIEQIFYADDNSGSVYKRQLVDKTWRDWKKVASIDDVNARLPLAGGNMTKGSWIMWDGSGSNDSHDGNIGGLQWTGATDIVRVFGDNNETDNLDLAIQLGNDNSNHISIRDKDGTERAAITADGHFTGSTDWARVSGTGINNPTLFRHINSSNTWNDIIGQDNGLAALTSFRDETNGSGNTIGNFSSGIVFGGGDTKGVLNVAYDKPQARIIGGNGTNPVWSKDIAWKDDLKVNVVRSYDIENNQAGPAKSEALGGQWLVDQVTLGAFANAHRDVRNHTDYRYPTDQAWNTAINLNSDPYLDTGIYKIGNCTTINGPWSDTTKYWYYLTVIKYDDNTIYQTVDQGANRFVRTVSKVANSYPQWSQFAMMNSITDLSDRLQGYTMQQAMFQHRVDYESPSGTINNDTVDFNNYRETGILKVVNCLIQNGPYESNNRHTVFLKITNLDGQTQYQTVYEGDNLYGRKLYKGSGQWHKYTNTPI